MLAIEVDDFNRLNQQVSEDFGRWSESVKVTQAMIDQFSELSGDRQWIHTDVEKAKFESPYGGTIAHGFLILALMPRMRPPQMFKLMNYKSVTNYGSEGFKFISPVKAGAKMRSRQRLVDVSQHRLGTLITSEIVIHCVGYEKPAVIFNLQLLYLV